MEDLNLWLSSKLPDYDTGVSLFMKYSKNKVLIKYFTAGSAKFRMDKLKYELSKLAKSNVSKSPRPIVAKVVKPVAPLNAIPDLILAAKKEIASLYAMIDRQHSELYELGTSNSNKVVSLRKKILEERQCLIERADRLYVLKESYFALTTDDARRQVLEDLKVVLSSPVVEAQTLSPQKGYNVQDMSDIQLSKRRNQLRSSITKAQNMLQYQTIKKLDSPSPMPEGPKRKDYERRLQELKNEYTQVCAEYSKRHL